MQLLIFSDSHGASLLARRIIAEQQDELDGVIFLGDGIRDFSEMMTSFPELRLYAVAGNCDFGAATLSRGSTEQLLELDGYRIMIAHGHRHFVKRGTDYIADYAVQRHADAALFGHTHTRLDTWLPPSTEEGRGLHLFNPGSITLPSDEQPSWGVLTIKNGQLLLSHGIWRI